MIVLNGCIEPPDERLFNRAFCFGDGVFETIKLVDGKPLFWPLHLARLRSGMFALGIEAPQPNFFVDLKDELEALAKENNVTAGGRAKIVVWRGGNGRYTPETDLGAYVIQVASTPENGYPFQPPISLLGDSSYVKGSTLFDGHKTLNALPYVMAARAAKRVGMDDTLMFMPTGEIIETSRANVFFVKNGEIHTPPLWSGCLAGVMRKFIMTQITVIEDTWRMEYLACDMEIFTTNVIQGIVPVASIHTDTAVHHLPVSGIADELRRRFLPCL